MNQSPGSSEEYEPIYEQESILDVAVRWSHLKIVQYLLDRSLFKWTKKEIGRALSHAK